MLKCLFFVFVVFLLIGFYTFFMKLEMFYILVLLEVLFMLVISFSVFFIYKSWLGVILLTVSTCEAVLGISIFLYLNMGMSSHLHKMGY